VQNSAPQNHLQQMQQFSGFLEKIKSNLPLKSVSYF
jgi:hypothetical protein